MSAFFLSFFLELCRLDCNFAIFILGSSEFDDELLLAVVCIVLFESSGLDEELSNEEDDEEDVRVDDVRLDDEVGLSL